MKNNNIILFICLPRLLALPSPCSLQHFGVDWFGETGWWQTCRLARIDPPQACHLQARRPSACHLHLPTTPTPPHPGLPAPPLPACLCQWQWQPVCDSDLPPACHPWTLPDPWRFYLPVVCDHPIDPTPCPHLLLPVITLPCDIWHWHCLPACLQFVHCIYSHCAIS